MTTKQMNIKNWTYYFYNGLINIKNFDGKLLKLDKKHLWVLAFITLVMSQKKPEWKINSVSTLYLMINRIDGFIEEKNGDKYLNISSAGKNVEVLKKNSEVEGVIRDCIEKINEEEYEKDYIKIKFDSDDDIPLNKQLSFPTITDGKYYPQSILDRCLHEL